MPEPEPELKPVSVELAARVRTPPARPLHRFQTALRRLWRGGLLRRWQAVRGPIMLAIGLASLVLGTIGYLQLKSVNPRYGFFDSLYRAITLFVFGGAAIPPIPVALQIARLCAPLLTGYAAMGAVIALTREQTRVVGIRLFVRRHVVIAGLGATGRRLAETLVDHAPVVVIEADGTSQHLAGARLRGVRILIGSAADPKLLERAGIGHAETLIVTCGTSDANVDVAAAAVGVLPSRGLPLNIFVHLDKVELWSSLAAEGATFRSPRDDVRLEYFNAMATGAQLLVEHEPPLGSDQGRADHILIVGLEGIAEQLLLQFARVWSERAPAHDARLRITLTGDRADVALEQLVSRHPALVRYLELDARPIEIASAAFQAGAAMSGPAGRCDVTRAYVTLLDETDALHAALALHARPDAMSVPVTVAVADDAAGVSSVLGSERGRFSRIEPFGVLSAATRSRLLLRGTNELLARAQHAQWLRGEQQRGITAEQNPNLRPWDELTDEQREYNRQFADSVHSKLASVNCMIVPDPLPAPDRVGFTFRDDELEDLAEQEHARWVEMMCELGWHYGPQRDNARRIHDQLKPWSELDEPNRDKDRGAVREIPRILAVAGFAIQRIGDPASALRSS